MPQDKPLYTLYKGLRANNYDVPDNYASFERTLTEAGEGGAKSRHTLYRALKSQNYDVPDTYERFYNTLFDVVNKTTSRAKPAPSSPSRPRPSAHAAPAGQRQRAIAGVKNTVGKIVGMTQQMAHQVESARPAPRKSKTPAKPLTAAQKQQMIAGAQAAVGNVAAGNRRVANQIAFANANLGLQANPARLGQNGRVAVRGADGKVRKPQPAPIGMDLGDSYVTELGNEYSDRSAADREQSALDAIRYNREHRREYLEAQKRRIEQEMNQRGKELDAEALDFSWRDMPRGSGGAVHTYNSSTANGRFADIRYMALSAQLSQVNDALGVLDEAEHGKASDAWINNSSNWFERKGKQLLGFGAGAWRGLAHAVGRVNTWDLGMTDLTTNAAMYNATINHDKGKASKEERDLLDLAAYAKGVRAENEKHIGYGYEAGEVTGESLPFMIEMMLNPASGLGQTASNRIMRYAVKKYGKEAVRRATKKYMAAKIGTRVLGDVAGSAIMAGTSGQGRVHADALNRLTGDVKFKEDENGQIVYAGREGAEDSVVRAYMKAFGAQTIENHSEMVGEYFAPLLGRAASVTRKGMERIGLGSVNRFIDDVGATNAARMLKDFEGRAKWNGTIGEYAEEVLGNVENALVVGDMTLDTNEQTGVFNKDQNIRTFLGVGLMGGFLSGVKTASYRGPKRQALNDMAAAGKAVDEAAAGNDKMREKWADWRIKLLVGSEEEKVSTLREVMDDEQLPMGFRMGVLNFSKAAQKYEGLVRAQKSKKEEGAQDAVDDSYDESYDSGYDTTDPSAMHEAKVQLDAAREKLTKKLNGASTPEEANKIIDDPLEYIHAQRAAGASVEDLQEVVDYANAKSAFDGMLQRVRDDIDGRVDESDSMVDSRVNKNTGMITRATMKVGDRQVYVVDGIVAMHEDGSMVDVGNSSESILVRDAQTGKLEWASPHDILSVDDGVKPEEEKAAAAEAIRQEVAGNAAAQIDGVADGATAEAQSPAEQSQPATEATAANEAPVATAETHESEPAYALNDEITLYNEKGEPVHGVVNAEENEDGLIEVYTDRPINGNRINLYSREELDRMAGINGSQSSEAAEPTNEQVGSSTEAGTVEPAVASTENEQPMVEPQPAAEEQPQVGAQPVVEGQAPVEAQPSEEVRPSALERVPKDEQGQPVYEMAEPGTAWDAIVEQTGGDEQMAQTVAESMVADKKEALKKAEKAKARQGGTVAEKIAAEQERKAAIEQAKAELAHWQNIAMMQQQRRSEAERAKAEEARKAAEEKAAEEARLKAEREEAERKEREALDGVPDWTEDTAQNARARGFRRSNGGKYDRQEQVAALQGKEVEVKFADQVKQKARVAVMEADALQPSHHNGQPNVLHFIPEAQPKKRTDEASVVSSENMARNINPEEITSSVTAYTGAPTVNSRGEVIQGNNRSAALKTMWQSHADQAERYKQYLMEHAEEFGLNAEDIARMENPVLVNMADVDDEKAIELGQYDVKDTESGGTERIKPKNAVTKMGSDMKTFAARLLSSSDDEASFSQLVDMNGVDVLKWMNQKGFITPTQYKSAFDSKGNLTAEAVNDLKGIMYQSIFQNGSERLEEMFNTLPAKAQRALLATAYRDFDSPQGERMVPEIQQSIMAYHALMLDDAFANAKTMKEAQTAILMWQRQYQFDDATGESYLPTNKFSNFALQLAAMYKVQTQRLIQGTFNQMYDLVQGTQEADLFNQDTLDNTPRTLAEAIKEVLNIDYNGQQGSNVLGGRDETGQPRRQGSSGAADADGRGEEGERPAEREGGAEATDDNSSKNESQAGQESIGLGHDGRGRVEGGSVQRQGDLAEAEEIKLSDEIDENGRQFVLTSEGELAFGEIGEETGLTTAPILLSEGMITNPATNDGYGLAHIEARHGDQIRKAGYKSVVDFIETVAKNYDVIKEGNLRDGHQTYRLQLTDKHNNTLMIELSGDGTYWNINTAGIFKTSYGKKNKEVYSRHTTAKQPVEAAETSQDAEQRDTQASSSMNVPTSSKGKVTYKESTSQGNDDKSLGAEEKTPLSAKIDEASAEVNGGFLMRDTESAQKLAKSVLGDAEAVADAQPVSLKDMQEAAGDAILEEKTDQKEEPSNDAKKTSTEEQKPNGSGNRLVTDERYAELKKRMRKKLGQLNVGIDPEVLAIGTEMAVYHIEKGARKFAEYAKAMIEDMGDAIRPYLKAFYNGARDLPEVETNGWVEELTPYDEVRAIDIANFGKPTVDAMATAEMVVKEQEAERQKDEAVKKVTDERNAKRTIGDKSFRPATEEDIEKRDVVYYEGKPVHVAMVMHSGEQVGAAQFSKPHIDRIYLTNGKDCKLEDLMVEDKDGAKSSVEELKPVGKGTGKSQNSQKKKTNKKVKPEQQVGDLFAGMLDKSSENGLQRNDGAVRTERVPADSSGQQQGLRGSEEGPRKGTEQEGGRSDGSRGGQSTGEDRPVPAGLHGLTKPRNRRNNHSERGADHAPTSVNGRIEANIKAIELAHELLESGEAATPEQMSVLRQFSGWGGLGSAFGDRGHDWKQRERNKKIRELLGEEAYEQAVMSANSAYYTPAYVVDTLWDIAKQLGFKGGKILEGSAGIGNILGQMPTTVSERSDIHAIEIDGTSGGILSLLYPDAKVEIQGFEQTRIPNGSVDLAITNVPFVTGLRVNDTTGDSDLSKKFHNIHDFCIAKNVRKLREGGLGIFISSNGTLDNSKSLRDWVVNEGGSDFIGAFRMNNKTFGGTTVTSDIIVVRKRVNGQKSSQAIDVSSISGERTAEYEEPGARKAKQLSMDYNKYFIEHPDHMAGEMRFAFEEGDTFRPTSKGLYPVSGKDQSKMLADFVKSFTEEDNSSAATTDQHTSLVLDASADGKKLGEMYMKDGKIVLANIGGYYPLELNDKKIKGHTKQECFTAYAAIKSALADVMQYQTDNEGDTGLKPLIAKLNKAYDDFVNTYGHLHKNNQLAWLRNDVDYPNVFSLEIYKEQGDGKGGVVKTYDKADVMKGRVVEKENEPHPENVKDGVVVSMFKNGRIDVPYIASQVGKSEAEVKREIIESGLGFEDPATRQMEVSYQYLSGNVREKLKQAEANNENGEYSKNIKALQEVVPMNIPAHLIDFTLGSSWLDPKLYDEYVKERTGIDVHFTAAGGTWFMKAPTYGLNVEKNRAMGIVSEMLKRTVMGHELIGAAIQNKSVVVSRTEKHYDGTTETITDREATAACAAKIDEIRQDFKDWMRGKMQSDSDLSERIEQEYNDRFNNYVPMSIPDDFVPEYFEGATHKFKMRPHQGKAIVRGTMQPLLLAHEVGTGKTFTLISTAMEMRRLGTARKPMIVVQNATVGQFAASAKELYPNVKILTLEDNDRNAEGRKNFYAKIKYNDWDMIVVPQSTFEFIPDSDERQMQFVQDKIDEKMIALEQMRKADTSGRDPITRRAEKELADLQAEMAALSDGISKKRTANDEKKKAVAKQNAAVKAQEMLDRRTDDVENFDDMGIDALLIDEAHEYKHLGFATAMQRGVKGIDPSYSKKSQGVYLKTQAILEKNNGRNVIFATGTPISNTAAEIWTFMRYLMPKDTMKEYGIYYFDDFVRNFGNIQQMPEFNTSGKFKEVNRFAGYVNLPELVRIWSGVADTVLTKDQTELVEKIPEMEGGKAQDIYLPQTRALRSVMKYVRSELHRFDQMSSKEKKKNSSIPLTMYGIAQGAAVDARLVEMDAEDDPRSKTNEAVRQTLRSLKETDDYKGTVAIFADHYQNKRSGFNLYEDIKKKLVQQGVPESEVIVMKPGMTIKKKLEIFDKVNRGEVRIILGSTATLGTGVNIQERLHTLIHLDAPNRPMDYTQRNGRILRQGNLHKQWGKPVRVLRFGVEDSLDVTAYQRLKTKGAIADSIMEGDRLMQDSMNNRVLEEEEDVFGDTVAQLSGSEYALLKNNAEKNVRKYESRRKQWEADQTYIHNAKPKLEGQIKAAEQQADNANTHLLAVQKAFPDGKFTEITVGKQKYGSVDAMADFIKEHNKKIHDATKEMKEKPGNDARTNTLTLSLGGYNFVISTELSRETVNNGGSLFAGIHRAMTYSCPELGLKNVPVKQSLLRNAIEDITENVITGKDFAERFDIAMSMAQHAKSELEQLKQREGKPFEFGKELEEAKRQFEEYSEAMKEEMAEKEKKYAEMDAGVEAASDISIDDEEKEDVLRDGDGVYSDEDLSLANDPSSKLLGESRYSATQRQAFAARTRKNMADHVRELAERLHLDNVEVVTDASTLSGRRQKAKGFYNKRTGKITIVVGNHLDLADVEQTVLHEAVAHYGLRKLFGEHFDTFLDNVFMHADLPIRQRITELARRRGWDFRTATEEYLANLAEDTDFEHLSSGFYGWWSYVKDAFLSMLHKIGFREYDGPSLSDNELRYILWRSYENLKEPGRFRSILGEAEDVTRQSKLKVGNYAERRETDESHAAGPLGGMPVKEDVNEINQKFNDELQKQLDGTLPSNHIYKMGRPGSVLLSTGVPDLPIQMSASRLKTKATSYGHDFDLGEVKDLVKALQNPLAVFSYGDKTKAQNIIVPLQKDGKNFIVGLSLNPTVGGRSLEINSIRNVFPKNNSEWLNWIAQGKALFLDKEKIQTLIDQQRTILADVTYLDLDSVAKVVKDFVNSKVSDENVADEDVLFRDGDDVEYEKAQARMMYERRVRSGLYQTQEAMLDSMLGLKEAMSSVLKAEKRYTGKIEDVAGFENAYLGENRLSSVNQAECEAFTRLLLNPLLKEISKLARDAAERADLTDYMMAKHGLERNRVMAERDAKKAFDEYQKEHPKGTKTLQDFIDTNRKRDYAGLTALTGIPEVEDAEVEAQVMVDEYERDHDTTELWDKVNAVTKATLQKSYESGFLNKATYDSIRSMYDYYIPLRGFDEKTSDEVYAYLSEKHSAFNAPIKTARGRKSKADDPLANMMTMAESAIMQGNRNVLVKQRFLNFVLNHPSDLVSVSDLWLRYDDVTGEWHPVNTGDVAGTERIEEDDSPSEVARKMEDFEQAMSQLAESDPDHFVRQKEHPSIPYRVVEGRDLRQHQVLVKRNGKDFILTINGNPRAAQALNGQTNPDNDVSGSIGKLLGVVGDVNRTLSMLYTTLQPDFVASNFLRDTLYANTMVWAKETPRYAARFNKNYALTKRVMHLLGKYRKGTLNMGNETEKMFYQFMKHGGETGFFRMADIDQHKKEVDRVLKGLNEKIPARKIRKYLTEWIGEIGRGIEMRARFAAFITSRQEGRSIDRSVWDAKEISVNFNKKGAGDKFLGENGQTRIGNAAAGISGSGRGMFIFWNAALQGTFGNFGKYATRHPGKMAAVAATNFALGLLVSALASAGGGDDDDSYFDLPEHTRRQNLIIRGPGKTWTKIPLPMEYRAIYGMGELAGSTLLHNEPLDAGKLAGQVSQLLPVDLMEGFGGLWPSSVKPAWETYKNETWYGRPIWKETPFNTPAPQWTKAFDSTNPDLVNLASALNEASGGSDYKKGSIDLNPAAIEYLMKQYTGGFFTVVNQLRNLASVSLGKKDFDWRYVPLANRMLMTGGDERNANQGLNEKFFNYMDIYKAKEFEVSAITNDMSLSFDQRAALIGEIATDADYIVLRRASAQYESLYEAYRIAKDRGDQVEQNRLGLKIKELKWSLVKEMESDKTGSNNK